MDFKKILKFKRKNYSENKVILLGIPHLNWKLINTLIEAGKLKNLEKMIENGSYGEIIPQQDHCSSPVEFTSVITGVKKRKHSIGYGKGSDKEYIKDGRMITRLDIKSKTIWEIAQENGKKVGIYHWLLTWPPQKVNGFMITGRLSQDDEKTFPKELKNFLNENELKFDIFNPDVAINLIKKYDVDLFLGMDEWAHGPTHILWEYLELNEFKNYEESKKRKEELFSLYERIDPFFGKVEKEFPNATIIVLGDSGIRPADTPTYCTGREVIDLFKKIDIGIQLYAYDLYPPTLPKAKPTLYIPGKTRKEKEKITDVLSKIKLKHNGERFIKNISWNGDYLSFSFNFHPSFIDHKCGYLHLVLPNCEDFELWITKLTGVAVPKDAAFIAKGPSIKENYWIRKVDIVDVAPTVLYLLDIPIPANMDGKVLKEIIKD